jgi:5-methylcytosine-specific restriction endonuclease McrA
VDNAAPGGHGPAPVRPARSHTAHAARSAHSALRDSDAGHGGVVTLVRVLLLNASHEPLAVVTGRRALILVVAGKADCVAERSSAVRSPSLVVAVPAVVRLRRYVRVPYQAPPAVTRAGILRRDLRRCAYCSGRGDTVDHVVPKSRGGAHSWENCVACCVRCNTRKADRLLPELGWSLPFEPAAPRRGVFGGLWSEDADPAWKPWLLGAA